jgi:hypothetical protein
MPEKKNMASTADRRRMVAVMGGLRRQACGHWNYSVCLPILTSPHGPPRAWTRRAGIGCAVGVGPVTTTRSSIRADLDHQAAVTATDSATIKQWLPDRESWRKVDFKLMSAALAPDPGNGRRVLRGQ